MKPPKIHLESSDWKGHWALVTGASSGIGREFACQLAAKGLNLVLLARRIDLLEALADDLSRRHAIRALAFAADLAESGTPRRTRAWLNERGIRVRLLVNNAAFGRWGHFEAQDSDIYRHMIEVNVISPVVLCRELADQLSSFPSAAVINVSSPAALQPVSYMAAYAASKAFVHQFGQALHGEWAQRGVLVQTLVPGPTATEFDHVAGAYPSSITKRHLPQTAVTASLRALAKGSPVAYTAKGILRQRLFALMPAGLVIRTVGRMFTPPHP